MIYICYTHYVLICILHCKYQYLSTVEIAGEFGGYGECVPLCSSGVHVKNLSYFVGLLAVGNGQKLVSKISCRFTEYRKQNGSLNFLWEKNTQVFLERSHHESFKGIQVKLGKKVLEDVQFMHLHPGLTCHVSNKRKAGDMSSSQMRGVDRTPYRRGWWS